MCCEMSRPSDYNPVISIQQYSCLLDFIPWRKPKSNHIDGHLAGTPDVQSV